MIGSLSGKLGEKHPERVIVDVGGVGYEVRVPLSTYLTLPGEGAPVRLRIHTHVREESLQLFGFLTEAERAAFLALLAVSKVGPRVALAILSGVAPGDLARAVQEQSVAALRGIPGVGAKTAERILLELRGKVDALVDVPAASSPSRIEDETTSALVNLGYPRPQAERAVRTARKSLPPDASLEDLIREALRVAVE
jgi:holliday junction DNA helicase RuvA